MSDMAVIDIGRKALYMVLVLGGPMLLIALVIGLLISVFQAATQINEMTMTFIPKLVGIGTVILILMPTMMHLFRDFFSGLMQSIPSLLR